jgi:hypothetical protein
VSEAPGAPRAGQEILGERSNDQHIEQGRQSEPDDAVADKPRKTLSIIGSGGKIAGNEEQHRHEKGLQEALVGSEENRRAEAGPLPVHVVPIAERAVGVASVHTEHQQDHRPSDVVDEQ